MSNEYRNDELVHWGVRGMKWGVRRYQNADGSLTPAGQKRYNKEVEKLKKETAKVKAAEDLMATRKKNQEKIDKLETAKQELNVRKKALVDAKNGKKTNENPDETIEDRKARIMKSTDPKEIYINKDLLSYQELSDRVNRIDLETRLKSKIVEEKTKTGMDYVSDMTKNIEKATALFKSVDGAYSAVSNSAMGKSLAKVLGIEKPKKKFNLNETWKNKDTMTTQEIADLNKRLNAEKMIEEEINRRNAEQKK